MIEIQTQPRQRRNSFDYGLQGGIEEDIFGLNAGLNKGGFKRFLQKNVRLRNVSLKNAIKVGKVAIPIATSFIPGGAIAEKGASFLAKTGKVGRFASKARGSKLIKGGTRIGKKPLVKGIFKNKRKLARSATLAPTALDYRDEEANQDQPETQQAGRAIPVRPVSNQIVASESFTDESETQGEIVPVKQAFRNSSKGQEMQEMQENLTPVKLSEQNSLSAPLATEPKNNTLLYVAGGAIALGTIYMITQKK